MPKSIHVDHHDTAHYIPMYHWTQNVFESKREIYKSLEHRLFHKGRVVDPSYLEDQRNLRFTFTAIRFDCLLDINEKTCPEFSRILHVPCRGVCVFTSQWAISPLQDGVDSNPDIYPPPHEVPFLIRNALFYPTPPGTTRKVKGPSQHPLRFLLSILSSSWTPCALTHLLAPPSSDTVIEYVNTLGYLSTLKNVSTMLVNALYQPWSAILSMINMCFIGKTVGFDKPRHLVLQILKNLATASHGKKKTTHLLIPSIRFTKLIIHHLKTKHNIHLRSGSPLHYSHDESVLNTLEGGETKSFKATKVTKPKAAKATKQASDPKPKPAPTQPPKAAPEMKRKLVQETSDEPSPTKRSKGGLVRKIRKPMSSLKLVDEPSVEDVPVEEPAYNAEEANLQQALELSLEEQVERTQGPARPVVIREPNSRRIQPLPKARPNLGIQDEGQAEPNPGIQDKGQAGSNPGDAAKKQQEEEPGKTNVEVEVQSMVLVPIHQDTSPVPPMTTLTIDLTLSQSGTPLPTLTTTTSVVTATTIPPPPPQPQQSSIYQTLLSPSPQPLPPPPVAGASGAPAPQSTTWTTSDTRYESAGLYGTQELSPMDSLIPDDSIPDEQAHLSDDEDSGNDHIPTADSRNGCGNHYLQRKDHRLLNLLGPFILPKYQMLRTTRLLRWLQLM
nr:hypothetical protein [Tanacetum cinerariifolium]